VIMPFLTVRSDRATLRVGSNVLGGRGRDAVALSALASLPPTAVLVVRPDALSVIRRLAPGAVIRVDGHSVGANPAELRHGTRIDIGNCQLTYGHPAPLRAGPGADPAAVGTELMPSVPDQKSQYRLINTKTGEATEIPEGDVILGRERGCDIVVDGKGVSRRHAIIRAAGGSYVLVYQSSNGTLVNGVKLTEPHSLRAGDVITMGASEFRWETKAPPRRAPLRPPPEPGAATEIMPSVRPSREAPIAETTLSRARERAKEQPFESPATLATLSNGLLWRREFRINRPVAAIGRGEHNDVRIQDESVSASHATLVRKGDTWFVLDLGSSNGTFVDGLRVAGEREVPAGAALTLGSVKLTFHPRAAKNGAGARTHRVPRGELLRRLARLWEKGSSRSEK
jgi:pSer/pThr/pTyr-binding forkhead associated (FHA) protein